MKTLLFLVMMGSAPVVFAQAKTNAQAVAEQKAAGHSGHFLYTTPDSKQVNVTYSFSPLVPEEKVDFMMPTPTSRPLSVKVMNAAGKIVLDWIPENEHYLYKGTLDVSSLKAGKYTYKIYWADKAIQSIDFRKK